MKSYFYDLLMFILDITQTFIVAFAFFLIIYGFVVQPHKVSGQSMMSTLKDGELILTNKLMYRTRQPERGDVITFKAPIDPKKDYIKRIIGLPGEKLEISNNTIKIYNQKNPDGFILKEDYLDTTQITEAGVAFREGEAGIIPEGEYMTMGDNRLNSYDSRAWGPLKKNAIIGKAWFVYWPFSRLGFDPDHVYPEEHR
ncbi:MAG: signal peptidase I [bacterium]|nr:signal peptidase I [bacterium]